MSFRQIIRFSFFIAANMIFVSAKLWAETAEPAAQISWTTQAIRLAVMLGIACLLFVLLRFGLQRFESYISQKNAIRESESILRMKTLIAVFRWAGSVLIILLTSYMILGSFGIDMAPILAGAGIAGLAFGFGGQYLIRDLINGIFILIEGQYRINDVIKVGEHAGLVEAVNLRHTRLRDLESRVIYIPNGEIKTVINFTKDFSHALLDIGVAYGENADRTMDVLKQIGKEMRQDTYFGKLILEDLEMLGVDAFGDSCVMIRFRIKTLPIKQWEVAREFRRRVKNKFDELGIELPFPHRTLYWGTGKPNDWMKEFAAASKGN